VDVVFPLEWGVVSLFRLLREPYTCFSPSILVPGFPGVFLPLIFWPGILSSNGPPADVSLCQPLLLFRYLVFLKRLAPIERRIRTAFPSFFRALRWMFFPFFSFVFLCGLFEPTDFKLLFMDKCRWGNLVWPFLFSFVLLLFPFLFRTPFLEITPLQSGRPFFLEVSLSSLSSS